MPPSEVPWRRARSAVLGASSVALSTAGHIVGGGRPEPVTVALCVALATLAAYGWLRTERGFAGIAAAVVLVQVATHAVLSIGHAHAGSAGMLAGHLVAAGLLAVLLRHGEARVFSAARRRYLQWRVAVRTAMIGSPARRTSAVVPVIGVLAGMRQRVHGPGLGRAPPAGHAA